MHSALEVAVGVVMVGGLGLRVVSAVSVLLLVAFIVGVASAWAWAAHRVRLLRWRRGGGERDVVLRRVLVISLSVIAVLAAVIVTAILVQDSRSQPPAAAAEVPGATAKYGVLVGQASAPVRIVVYEDFQCPFCREFESASSGTLKHFVAAKKISVEYRPIAFLDSSSSPRPMPPDLRQSFR